ncbi:Ti-type conjugative transfer relaxase TraA [Patulibacter medicamentivorans]|uniref:Ti-type conjugative transfer relaxase TraA n=1 Tax=Patulibacter medicamentivorans TaxID=1097667 RepID=H0E9B9_9ACTN|nr:MobF family relaxase [Patulibacter medicamentivorans]EHN09729.1 Ti-type conjugative transfer relaxase TraA [Patulibacter medicamentivorans]
MLSIGKIAPGQHRYYEQQVARGRDDYYSGKGEAPGEWTGAAAARLGLSGQVDTEQFNAMIEGIDPSDPELERRLNPRASTSKVAAYDLTFSAPKSVSVLYATADAATAADLVDAHERSVRAALQYLEDEAVKVRRGKAGAVVQPGGGLIAAAYRHRMARSLDPQLHTHVVCANLSEGPDGRWTALHARPIYQHAKAAGTLYQAHLRAEVRERLGLEWGDVHKGAAELRAIDAQVLKAFSRRREQMKELAAAGGVGLDTKASAEAAALGTRDRKSYDVDTVTWREEVRARAEDLGFDDLAITELLLDGRDRLQVEAPASAEGDLVELGAELTGDSVARPNLTALQNSFGTREAIVEVASAHPQGARVSEIRARTATVLERQDVHELAPGQGGPADEARFTTTDQVTLERKLIAAAVRRADADVAVVDERTLERVLAAADRPLNEDQERAVRGVTRSGNGVDVVEALAGTGKTYTAGVIRQAFERAGHHVIGAAPTGRAVRELHDEAGLPSWTLDGLFLSQMTTDQPLPDGTVVLLDEAGMASTRTSMWLLEAVEACNGKVIAIGDSGQLPSVMAGGWMHAVGQRVGDYELIEVMRQRDPRERRVLGLLHDGKPEPYVDWLDRNDRLSVHREPADALSQALEDWVDAVDEHGLDGALLITRNNDTRAALNARARAIRHGQGELQNPRTYGSIDIAVGDRVIARRNDRLVDVDNGTRGTVTAAHRGGIVVQTDSGSMRRLPAEYVAEHVEHAYALTGHGIQGGTVEWAGVVAQPRDLTRGWAYTALSRARGETHAYVQAIDADRQAERDDLAPHDAQEDRTRTRVLEETKARMSIRDDEDLALDQLTHAHAPDRDEPTVERTVVVDTQNGEVTPIADDLAAAPTAARARLQRAARERTRLRTIRDGLPLRPLERLDRAQDQRVRTLEQRDSMAQRYADLPAPPEPTLLRRAPRDEQAAERTRLRAGLAAADAQLQAIDEQIDTLRARIGDPEALRAQRLELADATKATDRDHQAALDELVAAEIREQPAWATRNLGTRPNTPAEVEAWDRAVRDVTEARLTGDPEAVIDGLGPEPTDREARRLWQDAREQLERSQRALGREAEGPVGLDRSR